MNPAELLALYDQTMRRDAAAPGAIRTLVEPVVRLHEQAERRATIIHAASTPPWSPPACKRRGPAGSVT